jgi:hypothetical protein
MAKKKSKEQIYLKPFAEAVELGERKLYHASMAVNTDRAVAIDTAVTDSYKGGFIYELENAVNSVIVDFGVERTKFVVAVHLKRADDGRFSNTNKNWAATLDVLRFDEFKYIHMNTHASILDGFADYLRKIAESQTKPKIGGYSIKRSVMITGNLGFALGESKTLVAPFVTWQLKVDAENGEREYLWGHYFSYKDDAIYDYKRRTTRTKTELKK